jgi:hypothetical protein
MVLLSALLVADTVQQGSIDALLISGDRTLFDIRLPEHRQIISAIIVLLLEMKQKKVFRSPISIQSRA